MPPRSALLLAAIACAACFSPDIADGVVPCGANGECPSGFECRATRCFKKGGSGPTADAALAPDAPLPADARPPGPDAAIADAGEGSDNLPPPDAPRFDAAPSGPVNVVFMGSGGGSVSLNGGTPCTSDCSPTFPLGTVVTLIPAPSGNSTFAGWGGACSGSGACQVTVDAAGKTVEVTFNQVTQQVRLMLVATGPGKVVVAPDPLQSCGPGCSIYSKGTPITLTPQPNAGFSFIGWSGAGCEVVGIMPCMFAINADQTVTGRFCEFHHVVDATTGVDTNAGTCVAPFKTVTKALSVSIADEKVQVRPGLYNANLGETFPLEIPDKVSLVGDESGKGTGPNGAVRLEGGGPVDNEPALRATVVLGAASSLNGFLVIDPPGLSGAHAIVVSKPGGAAAAQVLNNTVQMSGGDGIYVNNGPNSVIRGNVVTNQDTGTGIRVTDEAVGALLEMNVVRSNQFGVEIDAAADLGGGGKGGVGGNTFSCNDENDLIVAGPVGSQLSVFAEDNAWDHMPPQLGCGSNIDLCAQNATVSTTGATLAQMSCP